MPGIYQPRRLVTMAVFVVGVVERDQIVAGSKIGGATGLSASPPAACIATATRWSAEVLLERHRCS